MKITVTAAVPSSDRMIAFLDDTLSARMPPGMYRKMHTNAYIDSRKPDWALLMCMTSSIAS